MKHQLTFEQAKTYVEIAEEFVPPEYGHNFALWLLDQMTFDDNGVTLWIPDIAPTDTVN